MFFNNNMITTTSCQIPIYLAYIMLSYCFACIYYLIMTRDIGTPFNDTLNPIQRQIKAESAKQRKKIFMNGLILGIIVIFLTKPFTFKN